MSEEERLKCPKCGAVVSKGDGFCNSCGANLDVLGVEVAAGEVYERRFSLFQRLGRILVSPRGAMRDIALAPDYEGVFVVLVVEVVLALVSMGLVFQRVQFVGQYASQVGNIVAIALVFAGFLSGVLVFVRWLVKSLIVQYICGGKEVWGFKAAAAVTGYAYIANVFVSLIGLFVVWFSIPTVVIDVSSSEAAMQSVTELQAKLSWLQVWYSVPVSFLGLVWKSCLGGLGVRFGTGERYSFAVGTGVFLILGMLGLLPGLVFR